MCSFFLTNLDFYLLIKTYIRFPILHIDTSLAKDVSIHKTFGYHQIQNCFTLLCVLTSWLFCLLYMVMLLLWFSMDILMCPKQMDAIHNMQLCMTFGYLPMTSFSEGNIF